MTFNKFSKLLLPLRSCRAFTTNYPQFVNETQAFIPPIKALEAMTPFDEFSHTILFEPHNLAKLETGSYRNFRQYSQCLDDYMRLYYSTSPIYSKFKCATSESEKLCGGFGNIVAVSTHGGPSNKYLTNAHTLAPKLIQQNNLNSNYSFGVTDKYEYYGVDKFNNKRIHTFDDKVEKEWHLQKSIIQIPGCGGSFEVFPSDLKILYWDNIADIVAFEIPLDKIQDPRGKPTSTTAQYSMILSDDIANEVNDVQNMVMFGNWSYTGVDDQHPITDMFNRPISTKALKDKFGKSCFLGWNQQHFESQLIDYLHNEPMFPHEKIPKHLLHVETNDEGVAFANHYLFAFSSAAGSPISIKPSEIAALHASTVKRLEADTKTVYIHNRAALITKEIITSINN